VLVEKLVSGTNKVVVPKRDKEEIRYEKKITEKLEKPVEVEKYEKSFLIEAVHTLIGDGVSLVYYYSNKISFGFDSLNSNEEETMMTVSGEQKDIYNTELSTTLTYGRYHPLSGSFYLQFGFVNRDWLLESQSVNISDNKNIGKYKATYGDSTTIAGIGWNWIMDIGLSFSIGIANIPSKPDFEYVEENGYIIAKGNEEVWEYNVTSTTPETLLFTKLGWHF